MAFDPVVSQSYGAAFEAYSVAGHAHSCNKNTLPTLNGTKGSIIELADHLCSAELVTARCKLVG